jgi:ferredoxin
MGPRDLDDLCPDWRERDTFASGPGDLLDALTDHFEADGDPGRLHTERFQPVIGGDGAAAGEGGTITFATSGETTECDGGTPILVAGEQAGLELPFGCRMGVCHTCIGRLASGRIRDLRSGDVSNPEGEMVRTCIHAPEGPVEIEL